LTATLLWSSLQAPSYAANSRFEQLVDINDVDGLNGVRHQSGQLQVGATTRHAIAEREVSSATLIWQASQCGRQSRDRRDTAGSRSRWPEDRRASSRLRNHQTDFERPFHEIARRADARSRDDAIVLAALSGRCDSADRARSLAPRSEDLFGPPLVVIAERESGLAMTNTCEALRAVEFPVVHRRFAVRGRPLSE
jgi:hypothetical protein